MSKTKILNKTTKKTFEIDSSFNEKDLIEACCNYYHSGYEYKIFLLFHALAHFWKGDKLIDYVNLIEEQSK